MESKQKILPKDWKVIKLGEVCDKMSNGANAKQSDDKIGFPISRIETIWNGTIDLDRVKYIIENDSTFVEKYSLKKNDILFSHINSDIHLGKTAIFKNETQTLIHGINLLLIRLNKDAFSDFFNYQFKFKRRNGEFISIASKSVNQSSINQPKLKNIDFVIPPLSTQQAIVSKIEELFSELDKGIENLKTAQQQLKTYRQAVLKWAFEGKLTNKKVKEGELPKGWKWINFGDLFLESPQNGLYKPSTEYGTGTPIMRIDGFYDGTILNDYDYKRVRLTKEEIKRYEIVVGDILVNRVNSMPYLGKCGIVKYLKEKTVFESNIMKIKVDMKVALPEYLTMYLSSKKGLSELRKNAKQAVNQASINQTDVSNVMIPNCPIKEQNKIIQEIESRLSVADKMEESISQSLMKAEALRQSILKKAFEGKLINTGENTKGIATKLIIPQPATKVIQLVPEDFPKKIAGITETDLHAGIISLVVKAHESNPRHLSKLSHIKCEKIAEQVERKLGISLGRNAVKDAAGPDDYPHLKKVEHRATKAGFFRTLALQPVGHTYKSMRSMQTIINKTESVLSEHQLNEVNQLIKVFLPFELEHAELVATLFAGWNNLLISGKNPTEEEIVFESRENWSKRKLTINRTKFFKTLIWMKQNHFVPEGKGKMVLKNAKIKSVKIKNA